MKHTVKRMVCDEDGATMVEYVLLVALIAVVAIVSMKTLGNAASNKLNRVAGNIVNSN